MKVAGVIGNKKIMIAGRFEVQEKIGAGAMGVVYRGVDCQLNTPVAIKELKSEIFAQEAEFLERFIREGEALRQLNHPNIVKMFTAHHENDHHYIVMELVDGGTLSDLLHKGPLPVERVIAVALELSDALSRAHHLKIIHRDLKPGNVLLAADGTPRLTDFGVAHMGGANITQTGSLVGTLAYLSPESFANAPVDSRTDIWSFGIMLFEMLAGQKPFRADSTWATMNAIMHNPLPDLEALCPDAPLPLVDLIYRMLAKNPDERISSMRLIGAELEALSQGKRYTVTQQTETSLTPTSSPVLLRHNLPTQTTPFVGRDEELSQLTTMLKDPQYRLVTIIGQGGMGKTRLSLEVAGHLLGSPFSTKISAAPRFQDGIYFVALAPISDPGTIVTTLATVIGYPFQADARTPEQQLIDYLRHKELLLVIDNFEHVISGAGIVSDILQAAPGVKVLATSRERLNLGMEQLLTLSGMDFPDWETPEDALEYSAVKLFMQSARRISPGFELRAEDLRYVARICRLVEGLPLGILLAAAWIETLSLEEIAQEIAASIDFLETDQRDLVDRHRSLRAVFDYSWNLSTDSERSVLKKLSVFRNGMTRQAAQVVAGASLRDLNGLVNKSLLRRNVDTGRYEIHELLRQYAESRLNESPEEERQTREQHCNYYASAIEQREPAVLSPSQTEVLDDMQNDMMNVRRAWEWAVEHRQFKPVGQMVRTLDFLYFTRNAREGYELFRWTIDKLQSAVGTPEERAVFGKVMGRFGDSAYGTARHQEAIEWLNKGLEVAREFNDQWEMCFLLCQLTFVYTFIGNRAAAKDTAEEAQQLGEALHDEARLSHTHYVRGFLAFGNGMAQEAIEILEYSLKHYRSSMNPVILASSLIMLALALEGLGQFETALQYHQETLVVRRRMNWVTGIAFALRSIGDNLLLQGKYPEARPYLQESLEIYQDLGQTPMIAPLQASLANTYSMEGDHVRAWDILLPLVPAVDARFNLFVKCDLQSQFRFREKRYAEAMTFCQEGIRMAVEHQQRSWEGVFSAHWGLAELALGELDSAHQHLREALTIWLEHPRNPYIVAIFYGLSWWAQQKHHLEQAVELAAMAQQRFLNGEASQRITYLLSDLHPLLSPEAYTAAYTRGQQTDLVAAAENFLNPVPKPAS